MNSRDEILDKEYCWEFDEKRKNAIITSYYKYGPSKENFKKGMVDAIGSLKKNLKKFEETGNTEFLVDVANFAMIEFMFPKHPNAHFKGTDSGAVETVGTGINEILREAGDL